MPKKSIKKHLIFALSSLITIVLLIAYLVSFFTTKNEIKKVFDANLIKSSQLIFGVVKHEQFSKKGFNISLNLDAELQQKFFHRYDYKIHSQAWHDGNVIYNSGENLKMEKPDYEGFKDMIIDQKKWRSFSFYDSKSQIQILVLEEKSIRNKLIFEILFSLLVPLLLSFVPLFFIIAKTVTTEFKPLDLLTDQIKKMSSRAPQQLKNQNFPLELKPFFKSFNSLLGRFAESMESERRFTDYAAHELNTPLAAIKIQAQLLAKNKEKTKDEQYLQDLLGGIERATHLVDQLLTLSRIEPDNKSIKKEKFNLRDLVEFTLENYRAKAEARNIEIDLIVGDGGDLKIEANKTYIEILLRNLIDNAIKYSFDGKKITVEIGKKNHHLFFKITNSGNQIAPEEVAKIFNNFYRVNREVAGCGLGLAIAKKIVDLHLGVISFKSKDESNRVEVELTISS